MTTFVKASAARGARTLDSQWYCSPDIFARENERIFSRSWICAARIEDLEEPGRYVVREIAGESLILTADDARNVRAFYNVCRHRGTRLCADETGIFKGTIQCPYHAWTYGLDGALRVARNMDGVEDFDLSAYPLREASVAQFEGFVFVALDPLEPFAETFASLAGRFAAWQLPKLRRAASMTYDVACNWKLVFQNYSECYHCPVIHPQLERLSPSDSGRNDLIEGPFLGGYSELRESAATLTVSGRTQRPLLAGDENSSRVYYYTIFPSLLLGLHPDYVMVHYVQPLGPARTRIVCDWLFDPQTMAEWYFDSSDVVDFWDLTNRQDWAVNELTQAGVASRAYTPGPYSQQEGLLHAFDRHYLRIMR
ncbi:MAG TPA: aromatic ring-hydroxylating dioxygenase subunit alpha [Candidatus Rubrimentiphilum sp.]|nr:aromatic ring-hydroxylating dioxygenase subunit alpha [Candidatus Rubrimentiphilum sp.]